MDRIELPPQGRRRSAADLGAAPPRRRWFDVGMYALLFAFACGWTVAVIYSVTTGAPRPGLARVMANPLSPDAAPPAPYLLDAALRRLMEATAFGGTSGEVQVLVVEPGDTSLLPDTLGDD
ncbi:MAG: hypothetical protein ACREK1_08930, partial [Longimicrobiales bacterium]